MLGSFGGQLGLVNTAMGSKNADGTVNVSGTLQGIAATVESQFALAGKSYGPVQFGIGVWGVINTGKDVYSTYQTTGNVTVTGAQWASLAGNGLNVVMGLVKSTPWGVAATVVTTGMELGFNIATKAEANAQRRREAALLSYEFTMSTLAETGRAQQQANQAWDAVTSFQNQASALAEIGRAQQEANQAWNAVTNYQNQVNALAQAAREQEAAAQAEAIRQRDQAIMADEARKRAEAAAREQEAAAQAEATRQRDQAIMADEARKRSAAANRDTGSGRVTADDLAAANASDDPIGTLNDRMGWTAPIVIDLDGDGVEIKPLSASTTFFDFDNDGYKERTAWAGADDGLLMIDLNGDGQITQSKEIAFAEWTSEQDTDLQTLATVFDSNKDGTFDSRDARFNEFRIWKDANSDGQVDAGELMTLAQAGIQSMALSVKDGTDLALSEGTRVAGLFKVQRSDGKLVDGADVTFAYATSGMKESVDAQGNRVYTLEGSGDVYRHMVMNSTQTDVTLPDTSGVKWLGVTGDIAANDLYFRRSA